MGAKTSFRGSITALVTPRWGSPARFDVSITDPNVILTGKGVYFENYSTDQLVQIIVTMIESNDYRGDAIGTAALARHFDGIERTEMFGNAREARKLFESMRKRQAQRLRLLGRRPSTDELRELIAADVA